MRRRTADHPRPAGQWGKRPPVRPFRAFPKALDRLVAVPSECSWQKRPSVGRASGSRVKPWHSALAGRARAAVTRRYLDLPSQPSEQADLELVDYGDGFAWLRKA